MKLYGYFRSSASYRVRIALNLKGIAYDSAFVHLTRGGGEQFQPSFCKLNPQAQVPALLEDGLVLTQSLAIIEYLDETRPEPPLLPKDAAGRARVRALAQIVACDIHPIDNLRVLNYLATELEISPEDKARWYRHWVETGLGALEALLASHPATGTYCHGETPGLADACLVPQVFNARRFQCNLSACPTVVRIADACEGLDAFQRAAPGAQPDSE